MGWIGFGLGMGFRTARYTRYAVRSTIRSGTRRNCRRSQPQSQSSGGDTVVVLIVVAVLLGILFATGNHSGSTGSTYADPASTYGPPGLYGYGMDSGTGRISALNKPPGTQPLPGQHTIFPVSFRVPTPATPAENIQTQEENTGVIATLILVAFIVVGLFLFLPKPKLPPAQPPRNSSTGSAGIPPPDDGPLNPRMYYSNRR